MVSTTSESVKLSWNAPDSDGGAAIGNYVIEKHEIKSKRGWTVASRAIVRSTTYEVQNLIKGGTYEFRVSAENEVGLGDASDACEPVMCQSKIGKFEIHIGYPEVNVLYQLFQLLFSL